MAPIDGRSIKEILIEVGAKDPNTVAKLLDEVLEITAAEQLRRLRQKTLDSFLADGSIDRKHDTIIQCAIANVNERSADLKSGHRDERRQDPGGPADRDDRDQRRGPVDQRDDRRGPVRAIERPGPHPDRLDERRGGFYDHPDDRRFGPREDRRFYGKGTDFYGKGADPREFGYSSRFDARRYYLKGDYKGDWKGGKGKDFFYQKGGKGGYDDGKGFRRPMENGREDGPRTPIGTRRGAEERTRSRSRGPAPSRTNPDGSEWLTRMDFLSSKTGRMSFALNKAIRYDLAEKTCGQKTASHTAPVLMSDLVEAVSKTFPDFTEASLREYAEDSYREDQKRFEIEGDTIRALLPSRESADFQDEWGAPEGPPRKQRVADGILVLKSQELVEEILGRECGLLDDKVYDMVRDALGFENLRDVGTDTEKVTVLTRLSLDEAVKALLEEFDGILESDAAEMCFEYKDPSIVEQSDPPVLRATNAANVSTAMKTRLLGVLHNSASYKSNVEKRAEKK